MERRQPLPMVGCSQKQDYNEFVDVFDKDNQTLGVQVGGFFGVVYFSFSQGGMELGMEFR